MISIHSYKVQKNASQLEMQGAIVTLNPVSLGNEYPFYLFSIGDVPISLYMNENFGVNYQGTEGRQPCDLTVYGSAKFLPPITACDLVIPPTLLLPAYLSVQKDDTIKFMWNKGLSIQKYHLQVAKNYLYSPDSAILLDTTITDTNFVWQFSKTFEKYYWRVQGINNEGLTKWAGTWIFLPDTVNASVSTASQFIDKFSIRPNPATTSATITYSLTHSQSMNLELIDQLGRIIQIMHEGNEESGEKNIPLSLSGLPDGAYYLRMQTDGGITTEKIVVAK